MMEQTGGFRPRCDPAGGSFGAPQTLSDPGEDALEPQIAVDSTGTAIVVWERFDGANLRVQAAVRPAGGSFGAPQTLSDLGQGAVTPQLEMSPDGNAAVVWSRYDGANARI